MLPYPALAAAVARLPRITIHGPWARSIEYALLQGPPPGRPAGSPPEPLWAGGAVLNGARFTPVGSFPTLYLASDFITAQIETGAIFAHPLLRGVTVATDPVVTFAVDGVLTDVVDLCEPDVQTSIGTTTSELTGSWRLASPAPTQELGRAAHASGVIMALRYPSAKHDGGMGLAIFTERLSLNVANYVEVIDRHKRISQRLSFFKST
jgi:RES domain-containing protein